jgi:hypothetical protein
VEGRGGGGGGRHWGRGQVNRRGSKLLTEVHRGDLAAAGGGSEGPSQQVNTHQVELSHLERHPPVLIPGLTPPGTSCDCGAIICKQAAHTNSPLPQSVFST